MERAEELAQPRSQHAVDGKAMFANGGKPGGTGGGGVEIPVAREVVARNDVPVPPLLPVERCIVGKGDLGVPVSVRRAGLPGRDASQRIVGAAGTQAVVFLYDPSLHADAANAAEGAVVADFGRPLVACGQIVGALPDVERVGAVGEGNEVGQPMRLDFVIQAAVHPARAVRAIDGLAVEDVLPAVAAQAYGVVITLEVVEFVVGEARTTLERGVQALGFVLQVQLGPVLA